MNEPYRTQFEVRCAFNGFCKKALKYEASSAHRDVKRYQKHFVSFSDLSPEEESQLYTVDKPFESEKDDNSFSVGGKRITPELLAEALRTLPEVKRKSDTFLLCRAVRRVRQDAIWRDFPPGSRAINTDAVKQL